MKLAEIPGGFALYKEKTAVGRCEVTATAQGAALTLLTIVPEWRRKGYGSYLLKEVLRRFGGYDKETATVFTAPLPGDEGERAFWEKFGFRAEGAQLCRRRIGKGDDEQTVRIHGMLRVGDEPDSPLGQNSRFAAARRRAHQQRAAPVLDGGPLGGGPLGFTHACSSSPSSGCPGASKGFAGASSARSPMPVSWQQIKL